MDEWDRPPQPGAPGDVAVAAPPDGPRDDELVAAAQADPRAFDAVWIRYFDRVFGYCLRATGSREDAEDLTDETFAHALKALPGFDNRPDKLRPWLFAIAHNQVVSFRRASRPVPFLPFTDRFVRAAPGLSPEDLAVLGDEWDAALRLLARMKPAEREVLTLRASGLRGEEIAAVLEKSHGAVRQIGSRAERRLRELRDEEARHGR